MSPTDNLDRATPRKVSITALAAAGFGILVGFVYSADTLLTSIFSRMSCTIVPFYQYATLLAPLAYLAAGTLLLLGVITRNSATKVAGVGLGASATVLFIAATLINFSAQAACQSRSLKEAMSECGANSKVYVFRPVKTWTAITLVPPGTTDPAFSCLSMWAATHSEYSIEIDEAVYGSARQSRN